MIILTVLQADLSGTSYVSFVKSVRFSDGTTYRYVFIEPDSPKKPYLLFLHGFPSSSFDWRHQIDYFGLRGYGVLAPDLLGYGGTDKPNDLESYRLKRMANDMVKILECEGIERVYAVGHDL
jgi:soluble epoxide hydrolase / lipid-phosphate phosphatase